LGGHATCSLNIACQLFLRFNASRGGKCKRQDTCVATVFFGPIKLAPSVAHLAARHPLDAPSNGGGYWDLCGLITDCGCSRTSVPAARTYAQIQRLALLRAITRLPCHASYWRKSGSRTLLTLPPGRPPRTARPRRPSADTRQPPRGSMSHHRTEAWRAQGARSAGARVAVSQQLGHLSGTPLQSLIELLRTARQAAQAMKNLSTGDYKLFPSGHSIRFAPAASVKFDLQRLLLGVVQAAGDG